MQHAMVERNHEKLGARLKQLRPALQAWLAVQIGPHTRRHFAADDIVSDAFESAIRNADRLPETDELLLRWLQRAATNRLNDQLRYLRQQKRSVRQRAAVSGSALVALCEGAPADCRSPSSEAAAREAVNAVREAMLALNPRHRRAITLRHLYGQALATVAESMKIHPRAAQGLIQRGLIKLRTSLGKSDRFYDGRRKYGQRADRDPES